MELGFSFFFSSVLLAVGLAMDAFSVSLANGLHEPRMRRPRMLLIAGVFAFFQAFMPMAGWVCVRTVLRHFKAFEAFIPWIALGLLSFIGGKMLYEGIKCQGEACFLSRLSFGALLVQGVATSIDALSAGFTISDHGLGEALLTALIIAIVTFGICAAGLAIGKKAGTKLSGKAGILGGIILIIIGLEIFITSFL